jgi:hypothetical protein
VLVQAPARIAHKPSEEINALFPLLVNSNLPAEPLRERLHSVKI